MLTSHPAAAPPSRPAHDLICFPFSYIYIYLFCIHTHTLLLWLHSAPLSAVRYIWCRGGWQPKKAALRLVLTLPRPPSPPTPRSWPHVCQTACLFRCSAGLSAALPAADWLLSPFIFQLFYPLIQMSASFCGKILFETFFFLEPLNWTLAENIRWLADSKQTSGFAALIQLNLGAEEKVSMTGMFVLLKCKGR